MDISSRQQASLYGAAVAKTAAPDLEQVLV
jgi:hypothetical protein